MDFAAILRLRVFVRLIIILSTFSLLLIQSATDKWFPELNFRPEFGPYLGCNSSSFERLTLPTLEPNMDIMNVSWYSIHTYNYPNSNQSYVLLSGAKRRKFKSSDDLYPYLSSFIVKCTLKPTNGDPFGLSPLNCEIHQKGDFKTFLGASMTSFPLESNGEILINCDPFWVPSSHDKASMPGELHKDAHGVQGQCQIYQHYGEKPEPHSNISNCFMPPCMEGAAIDYFVKKTYSGSEFMLSTGLPMQGIVNFYYFRLSANGRIQQFKTDSSKKGYGFSLAQNKYSIKGTYSSTLNSRVGLINKDIDFYTPDEAQFGFFGYALVTLARALNQRRSRHYGLLSSAPYVSLEKLQNVGRVYLICNGKNYSDYVTGEHPNSYFGYSLANLGDINYDGIDDFAVGAPYFENDRPGRVYIYATKSSCGIHRKPLQIIQSVNSGRSIRFGISLHGGVDLDFNTRPDLAVASQFNDKLDVFILRHEYKAFCKFTLPDQPRPFDKSTNYPVDIQITMVKKIKTWEINQGTLQFEQSTLQKIIHQVNPDVMDSAQRFELVENSLKATINGEKMRVKFNISSLNHIEKMNFTKEFQVAYRYVDDCNTVDCNSMRYLIDWSGCKIVLPFVQYHCDPYPSCNANLAIKVKDVSAKKNVQFGELKSALRVYQVTLLNLGPTQSKNTKLLVKAYGALRVRSFNTTSGNISFTTNREDGGRLITLRLTSDFFPNRTNYIFNLTAYFKGLENVESDFSRTYMDFEFSSGVLDSNEVNNKYRLKHLIVYKPNITITYINQPKTSVDQRKKPFDVRRGSAIQVDNLGPHLMHSYLLQNNNQTVVRQVNITIRIPVMTSSGKHLVYLFDQIRAPRGGWLPVLPKMFVDNREVGSCTLSKDFINPLELISKEIHTVHKEGNHTIPDVRPEYSNADPANTTRTRIRRSVDVQEQSIEDLTSTDNVEEERTRTDRSVSSDDDSLKLSRTPHEVIRCGKPGVLLRKPICAEVTCVLPELTIGHPATVEVQGWLFTRTYFKEHISDVEIFTDMTADTGKVPSTVINIGQKNVGPFYISQSFYFPNVKPRKLSQLPIWPIILGVILGVLLLTVIVVALYKCGFFKRRIDGLTKAKQQKSKGPVILHPGDPRPNDNAALL